MSAVKISAVYFERVKYTYIYMIIKPVIQEYLNITNLHNVERKKKKDNLVREVNAYATED